MRKSSLLRNWMAISRNKVTVDLSNGKTNSCLLEDGTILSVFVYRLTFYKNNINVTLTVPTAPHKKSTAIKC
jgi:hypothetical protein